MMLTVIVLNVMSSDPEVLLRDVEASVVPIGTKVTLQKGETAHITQSLGGAYTVIVNGNMFRIAEKDADALGIEAKAAALIGSIRRGGIRWPDHARSIGKTGSWQIAKNVL